MKGTIPVADGDTLAAVRGFLRKLLEQDVVDLLLVPMQTPGGSVTPALVKHPDLLDSADPLAPVMPNNGATLAGKLSVREPRARIGAVLRSCELRALIELVKLKQASTKDLTLIAIDCTGTFDVPEYQRRKGVTNGPVWRELFETASMQPEAANPDLRTACRICEQPVYGSADIAIELLGNNPSHSITISTSEELLDRLGVQPAATNGDERARVLDKLVDARVTARDAEFALIRERLEGDATITGVLDACIRCHNCMTVCPICYCKTCVFKSPVFDHDPMKYVSWANQKGALRLPADTSLFHLTRLNHMGLSCVGCGMCTQACPADLPVGTVFRAIGQRLQQAFDYLPGNSPDEILPLTTFKEDEWTDLGEE